MVTINPQLWQFQQTSKSLLSARDFFSCTDYYQSVILFLWKQRLVDDHVEKIKTSLM
uniref:Uncharacterized protein n=1 Tax=Arundo donax TaxID=35708 RepID=A0A0A9A116_ARUDO